MTKRAIYRHLRELREEFTPPPGFTYPEITAETLVMMMSPRPRHQLTAVDLRDRLAPQLPEGMVVAEATDTDDESLGTLRVPDLLVVPRSAMDTDDPLDPRDIVLAIEIVSPSNPDNDYKNKTSDYPAMGIPHYLIVDPRDGTWTYQWEIGGRSGRPAYENRIHRPYGDSVIIATELGELTIKTGDLPRYSAKDMMVEVEGAEGAEGE
ncbi:Uma2 family endonuclease [Streptomyces sp. NPDC002643]